MDELDALVDLAVVPRAAASPSPSPCAPPRSPAADDDEAGKNCTGCGRNQLIGKDLCNPEAKILWTRIAGKWCDDCLALWRTVYSATPQSMMKTWLQVSENRIQFDQLLAAYLTLREEGESRITGSMLRTRLAACKLFCRLLDLPSEPTAAVQFTCALVPELRVRWRMQPCVPLFWPFC